MLNQSMMLAVWCASSLAVAVWQDVAQPPIAGEKGGKVNDKSQRWKDLDPMLIGSVREILIDDSLPHLTPTRSVPIPEQCKMPRAILAVSGDPDSILLFGFNEAGAHLWLVDGTSGAIKKTLHSMKKDWPTEQTLIPLGKGSGVLFQPGNGAPILQIRTDGRPQLDPVRNLTRLRALIVEAGGLRGGIDLRAHPQLEWLKLNR